jgi:two-component sensor histidine kinase
MALNKQIHIYSVDTGAFYTETEKKIHKKMIRYGKYKNILKKCDMNNYSEYKKKKYRKLYGKINKTIKELKDLLKATFKVNTAIRNLDVSKLTDKNVISVFESTLTRVSGMEINELTTDIMVVQTFFYDVIEQIIKNGFLYNGEKYRYLTSSAGQIRTKKTVFIKESLFNEIEKTLMCGLTIDIINEHGGINVNKFLAYLALSNSATDLWEDFDIDRCIVVPDFETQVNGDVDFVDHIAYTVQRKNMDIPITHTDGCGMILPSLSKKNFMVRLPWVKGLLASFDFVKFIKENNCSPIIKDIYNKEWNILDDNIKVIFTESQFKMYKYYSDWNEYKTMFKQYNCQAGICNLEEDYFPNTTINYQMVQSLTDIKSSKEENESESILKKSKDNLYNLSRDKQTMLKAFGVTQYNTNKTYLQQALEIYPEMLQDEYCKHTLRQIKNSLIKDYRSAKLEIDGKYTFLLPDLYAFCEKLFLGIETPNGLLNDGEIFCKLYDNGKRLSCLRSPHLYREWANRNNIVDDVRKKWFTTNAIYTSTYDLISKILQFDVDGDRALVVSDETFVSISDRNMKNDNIVPLYYEMKKAEPVILNSSSIYNGLNAAYTGGNIGIYSNNISKIWNGVDWRKCSQEERELALTIIKLLCMENNFVIDYAKTLYKPTRPDEIDILINNYISGKLPHFFKYAKDKSKDQIEKIGVGFIDSLEKLIKNTPLRYEIKNFGKFNYRNLMKNKFIEIDDIVIDTYNKLNRKYHYQIEQKNKENVAYIIKLIKDELLSLEYDVNDVCDMLVRELFSNRKTKNKELLFQCFGDIIVENLKRNIPENSIQCEKCGERFAPNSPNQKLCDVCGTYQPIETKTIKCADCDKDVIVDSKDNETCRCKECKKLYIKERDRLRKRKYREKMSHSQF